MVTFTAGETTRQVAVRIIDDALYESEESFVIGLSQPTGGIGLGARWQAAVAINPSESRPFVYLAEGGPNNASYIASEEVGEIEIPVRLSDVSGVEAEVDFATTADTAVAGVDYEDVAGTLTFPPGVTQRLITVPIIADAESDSGEIFHISLSNADEAILDGLLPFDGFVRITDLIPEVQFAEPRYVEEEGQYAWFEVEIAQPAELPIEVGYRTSPGTAVMDDDFQPRTGTLYINPGETRSSLGWVFLHADDTVEENEELSIVLENPVNATVGLPASVVMEIIDRDTYPGLQSPCDPCRARSRSPRLGADRQNIPNGLGGDRVGDQAPRCRSGGRVGDPGGHRIGPAAGILAGLPGRRRHTLRL